MNEAPTQGERRIQGYMLRLSVILAMTIGFAIGFWARGVLS